MMQIIILVKFQGVLERYQYSVWRYINLVILDLYGDIAIRCRSSDPKHANGLVNCIPKLSEAIALTVNEYATACPILNQSLLFSSRVFLVRIEPNCLRHPLSSKLKPRTQPDWASSRIKNKSSCVPNGPFLWRTSMQFTWHNCYSWINHGPGNRYFVILDWSYTGSTGKWFQINMRHGADQWWYGLGQCLRHPHASSLNWHSQTTELYCIE